MNNDSIAKTIASLQVDITNATTPLEELATKFETLDQKIKKAQTSLTAINQAMGKQGITVSNVAQQTVAQTAATQAQTVAAHAQANATTVAATATQAQTVATKQLGDAMKKNSILADQWSRKISWFTFFTKFALFQYSELLSVA